MNYILLNFLLIITTITGCTKPNIISQDFKTEQIIHYNQIKNINNISNYVFYLNKGDEIPLKTTLDSELLDIDQEEINLILKQKIYFRLKLPEGLNAETISVMNEEEKQKFLKNLTIYLSSDAKKWAPYSDIKAVEQLFGIKGGSFSFGMGVTKEDGITMSLNIKTNRM